MAKSVSGNVNFDLHGTPHTSNTKSVSGDVTVRLPRTVGVHVRSTSASGTLLLDEERYNNLGQNTTATAGPSAQRLIAHTSTVSGGVSIM
ncbi:MAG: hypothetical protein ABI563_15070 [Specibacter sp.]